MPYATKPIPGKTRRLVDLAPDAWFPSKQGSSLFASAYRVLLANGLDFQALRPVEIFGVLAVPIAGALRYQSALAATPDWGAPSGPQLNFINTGPMVTPEGKYVLFLTPYDVAGQPAVEHQVRERIKSAKGFIQTFFGRNMAYEKIFDNILALDVDQMTFMSPAVQNPLFFGPPTIGAPKRQAATRSATHLSHLAKHDQTRIALALRWVKDASISDGVDAFLRTWFAIEILMMKDSNIKPISAALGRIYELDSKEAASKFGIGLIADLRARIVHKGQVVPIHGLLETYVRAIFNDLLNDALGEAGDKEALAALQNPDFDFLTTLHRPR